MRDITALKAANVCKEVKREAWNCELKLQARAQAQSKL